MWGVALGCRPIPLDSILECSSRVLGNVPSAPRAVHGSRQEQSPTSSAWVAVAVAEVVTAPVPVRGGVAATRCRRGCHVVGSLDGGLGLCGDREFTATSNRNGLRGEISLDIVYHLFGLAQTCWFGVWSFWQ